MTGHSSPETRLDHERRLDLKLAQTIQQADRERLAELTWSDRDRIVVALRRGDAQQPSADTIVDIMIREMFAPHEQIGRAHV